MKKTDIKFSVEINYTETVEEMVKRGKYDRANPNISQYNFPHKRLGNKRIAVELFRLELARHGRTLTAESVRYVLRQLDKKGFRPANLPELLAIEEHSKKGKGIPIVGFDHSHCGPDGNPYGIFLSRKRLGLMWGTFGFPGKFLIAVVRKKASGECILGLSEEADCEDLGDNEDWLED